MPGVARGLLLTDQQAVAMSVGPSWHRCPCCVVGCLAVCHLLVIRHDCDPLHARRAASFENLWTHRTAPIGAITDEYKKKENVRSEGNMKAKLQQKTLIFLVRKLLPLESEGERAFGRINSMVQLIEFKR